MNASDINDDPNSDASFDEEDDVVDPALMRMTQQKEEERRQRRVTQTVGFNGAVVAVCHLPSNSDIRSPLSIATHNKASSESGVIESVTLVNFMCKTLKREVVTLYVLTLLHLYSTGHKYWKVDFGPRINFRRRWRRSELFLLHS